MAQERPGQTLQATALVHETYFRLANVDFTVTMQGITIQNGEAMTGSLGVGDGGDVRVYRGHLLATDCMFSGNAAFLEGSGLFIESSTAVLTGCTLAGNSSPQGGGFSNLLATATLTGCTLSGNSAPDGGGMFNQGTATLVSDTFSGNSASFEGGGLFNFGTAALTDCTLSGNFALDGGGIASDVGGTLIVSGSNFSNNSASTGDGGAIITASTTALTQTTFTANSAGNQGGAIWNGFGRTLTAQATVTLTNTIVADNAASQFGTAGASVEPGAFVSLGHNLSSDTSGNLTQSGDLQNANPLLSPLGNYGGPTQTLALLPGHRRRHRRRRSGDGPARPRSIRRRGHRRLRVAGLHPDDQRRR